MRRAEFGIRAMLVAVAALSAALAIVFAGLAVLQSVPLHLAGTPAESRAADAARSALIAVVVAGALALAVATFAAAQLGAALAAAFLRLRRETGRLAEGARSMSWPASVLGELNLQAGVVSRLAVAAAERSASLAAAHAEMAGLIDAVSEGILQIDRDARIVRANRAAVDLLGLPRAPRGQQVATVLRHAELRQRVERVAAGEELPAFEVKTDDRLLLVSAHRVEGAGAIVVLVDLTEMRRLEDVRRDFVANASHELKTPLTSIRGYSETLLTDELPADMRRQFLETIRSNAERLQRIVDDLLDLSRIESGRWRPEAEPLDPSAVAAEAWHARRAAAAAKGLTLEADFAGDARLVLADGVALAQIFGNLFDNAIRYARPETPIRVRGRPAASGSSVLLEVTDQGTGIARDALPRIFERFYRVDPARSREAGGTGLGLAIVRHLVESMGGEVEAESELGKGTTIRFHLPAAAT